MKKKNNNEKKLCQFLKDHISGIPGVNALKFGIWTTEDREHFHTKKCVVLLRLHGATYV